MAVDTPARIAVLGAGPIGLEAALYGRFLGYDVDIYDQGDVADNVRRWGHVEMFTPFAMNASSLGLAALAAQDSHYQPPTGNALLTGREYVEQYLLPLSQSDLLCDHLRLQTQVLGVTRRGMQKDRPIGADARRNAPFELLVEDGNGQRRVLADVVLDATGTYRTPRWMGSGGLPAIGEIQCQSSIRYHFPDILGVERDRFAGRRTLLVGNGHSAATALVALAQLASENTATEVIWVTRRGGAMPVELVTDDALPARARLSEMANRLAVDSQATVRHLGGAAVQRVMRPDSNDIDSGFEVEIAIEDQGNELIRVDRVLALVGYRPDNAIVGELQVLHDHATEGPLNLATSLFADTSAAGLVPSRPSVESLITTEPRYFVLGSKSYGRIPHFLIAAGLGQIQQVFSLLADRQDLDLYANMQHLLR